MEKLVHRVRPIRVPGRRVVIPVADAADALRLFQARLIRHQVARPLRNQRLQLLAITIQFQKHPHLAHQHLGRVRLDDVVYAPRLVAHEHVHFVLERGREKNDRDDKGRLVAAQMLGQFVAVHLGHHHVQNRQREIVLQRRRQRFVAAGRLNDFDVQFRKRVFERVQILDVIVDDQYLLSLRRGRGNRTAAPVDFSTHVDLAV